MDTQMSEKSANLRIRVEPQLHEQFIDTCKHMGIPASQVIRQYMRSFIEQNYDRTQTDMFKKNKK